MPPEIEFIFDEPEDGEVVEEMSSWDFLMLATDGKPTPLDTAGWAIGQVLAEVRANASPEHIEHMEAILRKCRGAYASRK